MLYKAFRVILIFLSLAVTLLSIFALVGSTANKPYLTETFLIKFQLNQLNLKQVINVNQFSKRDWTQPAATTTYDSGLWVTPTPQPAVNNGQPNPAPAQAPVPGSTTPSGYYTSVPAAINDLFTRLTPAQLGIADVYSVGFWGYCRGEIINPSPTYSTTGQLIESKDSAKTNFTWCSKPKPGFFFNPVTVLIEEMTRAINGEVVDSESLPISQLTTQSRSEMKVLIDNINKDYFTLPGDLQKKITQFQQLTKAAFALTSQFELHNLSIYNQYITTLQIMFCAISGERLKNPVFSPSSKYIFEKRNIENYIDASGTDPMSGDPVEVEELIAINNSTEAPVPPAVSNTSIPSLLSTFQNEWDSVVLELFTLRKQLQSARQELSVALYRQDAAVRVAANAIKERDEAKEALEKLATSLKATNGTGEEQEEQVNVEDKLNDIADFVIDPSSTVLITINNNEYTISRYSKKQKQWDIQEPISFETEVEIKSLKLVTSEEEMAQNLPIRVIGVDEEMTEATEFTLVAKE
ncbi:Pre-mRNA-processing factor 19 [Spathaspora sp. JA1]|nr:Pre-mRNA-processing factor 19 [Spathaspora sp. JA1]